MRPVPTIRTLRAVATALAATGMLNACSGGAGALVPPSVPGGSLGPTMQSAAQSTAATQSAVRTTAGARDVTVKPNSLTFTSPGGSQKFVASEDDDSKHDEDWRATADSSDPSVCTVTPRSTHAEDPNNSGHENITFTVTAHGNGHCEVTVADLSDAAHNTAIVRVTVGTSSPQPSMSPSSSPSPAPSGSPTAKPSMSPTPMPSTSPTAKPSMSPTPTPSASPAPTPSASPTPAPTGCPNPGTTAPPQLSSPFTVFITNYFMPGQGDFPGNFNVRMTWTPPTFGVKVLESNTGTPGSFTDVSSSASSFGSVCVNHTSLSSDVSNNHSWRQGETVFFEVETVNNLGVTGPPSNVVSITLPVYNGSSGTVSEGQNPSAIITPGQPNDSIDVTWPNPLQGYRALYGHAPNGPFSTLNDEGFQIEREVPGFVYQSSDPSGTRECFEIQGYDQNGLLGQISAAACYQQP